MFPYEPRNVCTASGARSIHAHATSVAGSPRAQVAEVDDGAELAVIYQKIQGMKVAVDPGRRSLPGMSPQRNLPDFAKGGFLNHAPQRSHPRFKSLDSRDERRVSRRVEGGIVGCWLMQRGHETGEKLRRASGISQFRLVRWGAVEPPRYRPGMRVDGTLRTHMHRRVEKSQEKTDQSNRTCQWCNQRWEDRSGRSTASQLACNSALICHPQWRSQFLEFSMAKKRRASSGIPLRPRVCDRLWRSVSLY